MYHLENTLFKISQDSATSCLFLLEKAENISVVDLEWVGGFQTFSLVLISCSSVLTLY